MAWRRAVSCSSACESAGELGIGDMLRVFLCEARWAYGAGMDVRSGHTGDFDGAFAIAFGPFIAHGLKHDGEGGYFEVRGIGHGTGG